MKKKLISLCLALALCLGLTIPAAAAAEDQKIVVGEETYQQVLAALMSQTEDKPVTLRLDTDVQLTGAAVVIGSSDYNGLLGGQTVTIVPHDVTVDLNGHTLTGEKDCAIFEVQSGYTLTITDSSAAKTGKLAAQGGTEVDVKDGGTYNALPAAEAEKPAEPETPAEPEAPAETVNPFSDVAETSPYYPGILWAVEKEVTTGYADGTFRPSNPCTRAQIITFLWRAAGSPEPESAESPFRDVTDESAYYYKAVLWAAEKEIAGGGTFAPNDPCTRAMAVYFIWRANGSGEADATSFTDLTGDYAQFIPAVNWAVANGVTNGTTATTFSPDATCTRGQIATFLYRAAQAAQK